MATAGSSPVDWLSLHWREVEDAAKAYATVDARKGQAWVQCVLAERALQTDVTQAAALLRDTLSAAPDNEETNVLAACVRLRNGDTQGASDCLGYVARLPGTPRQAPLSLSQLAITSPVTKKFPLKAKELLEGYRARIQLRGLVARGQVLEAVAAKESRPEAKAQALKDALRFYDMVTSAARAWSSTLPEGLESALHDPSSDAILALARVQARLGKRGEAVAALRHALTSSTPALTRESCQRARRDLALLLLYGDRWSGAGAPAILECVGELPPPSKLQSIRVPEDHLEEALLLLLLYEHGDKELAAHDPGIYEHLAYALSLCGQYPVLVDLLEGGLPDADHLADWWYVHALTLISCGAQRRSVEILDRWLQYHMSEDVRVLLLAARVCYSMRGREEDAVGYSERAIRALPSQPEHAFLEGSAHHALGVSLAALAASRASDKQRSELQARALYSLERATALEPSDASIIYHRALLLAHTRDIPGAISCVTKALALAGGGLVDGWRLLALLLSSQQRTQDALEACASAVAEAGHPAQKVEALRTMAAVQVAAGRHADAIETYKPVVGEYLALDRVGAYASGTAGGGEDSHHAAGGQMSTWDAKSARRLPTPAGHGHAVDDADASRIASLWQELALIYTSLDRLDDADECVARAVAAAPHEADTHYAVGRVQEARGALDKALESYTCAMGMSPGHGPSALRLGMLYTERVRAGGGSSASALARCFLADALKADHQSHVAWHQLGMLHMADGRAGNAAEAFAAALALKQTAPAQPFSVLSAAFSQ
eukprot:jgi/Mesvir1/20587/Mv14825-RA.1